MNLNSLKKINILGGMMMEATDQVKINDILTLLQKIKFGSLTIVVHEGKITQLEVIEKHRFQK